MKIKPNPNCKFCYGTGEVGERHPYGDTYATEWILCECLLEQIPEGTPDDEYIEIDNSIGLTGTQNEFDE